MSYKFNKVICLTDLTTLDSFWKKFTFELKKYIFWFSKLYKCFLGLVELLQRTTAIFFWAISIWYDPGQPISLYNSIWTLITSLLNFTLSFPTIKRQQAGWVFLINSPSSALSIHVKCVNGWVYSLALFLCQPEASMFCYVLFWLWLH